MANNKVTSERHPYNGDLRCIFVGTRFWNNVPKKVCAKEMKFLRHQLAIDPWYCERRGY